MTNKEVECPFLLHLVCTE